VPDGATFIRGDAGDPALVLRLIAEHAINAIAHFAAKIVVSESVSDPLGYYLGNTVKSRNLIEAAVRGGVRHMIFSSTAAVYGNPRTNPVGEDEPLDPLSPYGRSKLMTEWMLEDAGRAHGLRHISLRYFNVAGADPQGRAGQSTARASHLIKAAVQAALGARPHLEVFGTDYPTKDGSCLRDYIQVTDLARAHLAALAHLRDEGESLTLNCGYGSGFSVLEVVEMVKRVSERDFEVRLAPRRPGDPAAIIAKAGRIRAELGWIPRHDDLREIVSQALAWERKLIDQRAA
jgi:UDP-glucose 4-epimerase